MEGRAYPVVVLARRCLHGLVPEVLPGLDLRSPTVGADFELDCPGEPDLKDP